METRSRRHFLKTAAAGVAAPFILPSGILSAQTRPNDRLAVGFIGMGKQSGGLLGGFLGDPSVLAVAVNDVDTTRREAAKKRVDAHYKNTDCKAYTDFRELIAHPGLDAVCIATPDHWHTIQCVAALEAGKDVYCEKPLTYNIHESVVLMDTVPANKRVLQTGSMQRSMREFRVACELVRNGVIGRIQRCEVNFGGPGIPCDLPAEEPEPGLDWEFWLGPAPLRPYNSVLSPRGVHGHFPAWRNYREYGGGMVTDWGAHHLDIVQWGLGMDDSGPIGVIPAPEKEAKSGAQLLYAGDIPVYHGRGIGVHFFGTEGEVQVSRGLFGISRGDEKLGKLTREDKDTDLNVELDKAEARYLAEAKINLSRSPGHIPDFLNSMRTRKPPITPETVGARSAIACHLLNLAYYHGEKLDWDPANNSFAGNSGQAAWLTRDYRGEWKV